MEQQLTEKLELKKAESDPRPGDIVLQMTDIQLHTNSVSHGSVSKFFKRLFLWKKPARLYSPLPPQDNNQNGIINFNINMGLDDPILQETIKEYRRQGKRVFIAMPKDGLPIFAGKDMIEFKNSIKGKRITRRLMKEYN